MAAGRDSKGLSHDRPVVSPSRHDFEATFVEDGRDTWEEIPRVALHIGVDRVRLDRRGSSQSGDPGRSIDEGA
jgi:hypothetical protein